MNTYCSARLVISTWHLASKLILQQTAWHILQHPSPKFYRLPRLQCIFFFYCIELAISWFQDCGVSYFYSNFSIIIYNLPSDERHCNIESSNDSNVDLHSVNESSELSIRVTIKLMFVHDLIYQKWIASLTCHGLRVKFPGPVCGQLLLCVGYFLCWNTHVLIPVAISWPRNPLRWPWLVFPSSLKNSQFGCHSSWTLRYFSHDQILKVEHQASQLIHKPTINCSWHIPKKKGYDVPYSTWVVLRKTTPNWNNQQLPDSSTATERSLLILWWFWHPQRKIQQLWILELRNAKLVPIGSFRCPQPNPLDPCGKLMEIVGLLNVAMGDIFLEIGGFWCWDFTRTLSLSHGKMMMLTTMILGNRFCDPKQLHVWPLTGGWVLSGKTVIQLAWLRLLVISCHCALVFRVSQYLAKSPKHQNLTTSPWLQWSSTIFLFQLCQKSSPAQPNKSGAKVFWSQAQLAGRVQQGQSLSKKRSLQDRKKTSEFSSQLIFVESGKSIMKYYEVNINLVSSQLLQWTLLHLIRVLNATGVQVCYVLVPKPRSMMRLRMKCQKHKRWKSVKSVILTCAGLLNWEVKNMKITKQVTIYSQNSNAKKTSAYTI